MLLFLVGCIVVENQCVMSQKTFSKVLKKTGLISYFLLISFNNHAAFLDDQLAHPRVKTAYTEKLPVITEKLDSHQLKSNNFYAMFKIYKYEKLLRVYVREKTASEWLLYEDFRFCALSGTLGPKQREWDYQVPEGYYYVNDFNPYSSFLLSMGVSYPNAADKILYPAENKGDGIYLHGGCATIGCVPVEDEPIKELYVLAILSKNNGQSQVPVHIFPFAWSAVKMSVAVAEYPEFATFWQNLYRIEQGFDSTGVMPEVAVNKTGEYYAR
jgi:murein L,D-transpeptidase YafK